MKAETRDPTEARVYDPTDPDPWLAHDLDPAVPMDDGARRDLIRSQRRRSRRVLLPVLRPLLRLAAAGFTLVRLLFPSWPHSSRLLHRLIHWGLKTFVAPEANRLILRHFLLGSEILAFIGDNLPGADIALERLRPTALRDLADHAFLKHDLNLYNFVIQASAHVRDSGGVITPPPRVRFDAITDGPQPLAPMPNERLNVIDLETAVEAYTPLYQLFLRDRDFWRASNSLQLDESIGIYAATILDASEGLFLVNNRHPLVPLGTGAAAFRLMLHGLATEQLHYRLRLAKRAQRAAESGAIGASGAGAKDNEEVGCTTT